MGYPMVIKRVVKEDIDLVKQISSCYKNRETQDKDIEDFLDNSFNYIIVSLDNDRVVGFLIAYQLQRFDMNSDMIYIHEIQVDKDYRLKGHGKGMIESFVDMSRDNQIYKIFLITNKTNKPAVCLYEKTGGIADNVDDVIYTYTLEEQLNVIKGKKVLTLLLTKCTIMLVIK